MLETFHIFVFVSIFCQPERFLISIDRVRSVVRYRFTIVNPEISMFNFPLNAPKFRFTHIVCFLYFAKSAKGNKRNKIREMKREQKRPKLTRCFKIHVNSANKYKLILSSTVYRCFHIHCFFIFRSSTNVKTNLEHVR